jgi:hypothetical protein
MIFFSFMSVNSGVAGRSRAKNRNGEDTVCISVHRVSMTPNSQNHCQNLPLPISNTGLLWFL